MNSVYYNERRNLLMHRYNIAITLRCYRTARARLKDVACLQHLAEPDIPADAHFNMLLRNHPELAGQSIFRK